MKKIAIVIITILAAAGYAKAKTPFDGLWTNGTINMELYLDDPEEDYMSAEEVYGMIHVPVSGSHNIMHVSRVTKTKTGWDVQIMADCPDSGVTHVINLDIDSALSTIKMYPAGDACWQLRGTIQPFKRRK